MNTDTRYLPALGRLLIALIFLMSGLSKITAPSGAIGYIASAGLPFPIVGYIMAVIVEAGGGLCLLIGFQTRIASALLAFFSIAAAICFHHNFADQNQMIHFMKNLAMAGGLLQVVAFGAGTFSLDARRGAHSLLSSVA